MAYTSNIYYPQNYQQPMYQPQIPQMQAQQQTNNQGLNWVQGESGAKSWIVGRGETVLLMDSENPVFYLKSSDNAGMPLPLRIFDYTERSYSNVQANSSLVNKENEQFVTREEYNALMVKYDELKEEVKKVIDGMNKPKTIKKSEVKLDE